MPFLSPHRQYQSVYIIDEHEIGAQTMANIVMMDIRDVLMFASIIHIQSEIYNMSLNCFQTVIRQ